MAACPTPPVHPVFLCCAPVCVCVCQLLCCCLLTVLLANCWAVALQALLSKAKEGRLSDAQSMDALKAEVSVAESAGSEWGMLSGCMAERAQRGTLLGGLIISCRLQMSRVCHSPTQWSMYWVGLQTGECLWGIAAATLAAVAAAAVRMQASQD